MIIDSHHHLWRYDPEQYGWISEPMSRLRTDYWAEELQELASNNSVDGFVAVQARQTIDETDVLCSLADQTSVMKAVVGWVPLAEPTIDAVLEEKSQLKMLKGVRHVIQDEPDDSFWLGSDFNHGISLLNQHGLTYDLLIYGRQLPSAIEFVDHHPSLPIVLDHIAKPTIVAGQFDDSWERSFRELARRPHVCCKWSGVSTEVRDSSWSIDTIRRYFDVMLDCFTPDRILFGSDWPVCLLATEYDRWLSTTQTLLEPLGETERTSIMGGNAIEFYGIA